MIMKLRDVNAVGLTKNPMRRALCHALIFAGLALSAIAGHTADLNTPEEAVDTVKRAIAYYKANGRAKAFEEINKVDGQFVGKEMFTVVLDKNGVVLAHGYYHKMIGQNIMKLRDIDGVEMVKGMFEIVRTKGSGWVYYRFPNPRTKVVEPKMSYVEKVDDLLIFCGLHVSEKK